MGNYRLVSPDGEESLHSRSDAEGLVYDGYEFATEGQVPILEDIEDDDGNIVQSMRKVQAYDAGRYLRDNTSSARLMTEEEKYKWETKGNYDDSWSSAMGAASVGALDGLTLGGAGAILDAAGVPVKEWKTHYPTTYGSADFLVSLAASIVATGTGAGAGYAAAAGPWAKVARLLSRTAAASPAGKLSRWGEGITKGVSASRAAKILSKTGAADLTAGQSFRTGLLARGAGSGFEGGLTGVTYSLSEQDWGDPKEAAENMLISGSLSGIAGAALVNLPGLAKGVVVTLGAPLTRAVSKRAYMALTDSTLARKIDAKGKAAQKEYKSIEGLQSERMSDEAQLNSDLYDSVTTEGTAQRASHEKVLGEGEGLINDIDTELRTADAIEETLSGMDQIGFSGKSANELLEEQPHPDLELSRPTTATLLRRFLFTGEMTARGTEQRTEPLLKEIVELFKELLKTEKIDRPSYDIPLDQKHYDIPGQLQDKPIVLPKYGGMSDQTTAWLDDVWSLGDAMVEELGGMLRTISDNRRRKGVDTSTLAGSSKALRDLLEIVTEATGKGHIADTAYPNLRNIQKRIDDWDSVPDQQRSEAHRFLSNWEQGRFAGELDKYLKDRKPIKPVELYSKDMGNLSVDEYIAKILKSESDASKTGLLAADSAYSEALRRAGISDSILKFKIRTKTNAAGNEVIDTAGRGTVSQAKLTKFKQEFVALKRTESYEITTHKARTTKWEAEKKGTGSDHLNTDLHARVFRTLERVASEVKVREEILPKGHPAIAVLGKIRANLTDILTEDGAHRQGGRDFSLFGSLTHAKREFNAIEKERSGRLDAFRELFMEQDYKGNWVVSKDKVSSHVGTPVGESVEGLRTAYHGARNVEGFDARHKVAIDYFNGLRESAESLLKKADERRIGQAGKDALQDAIKKAKDSVKKLESRQVKIKKDLAPALHHQDVINREVTSSDLMRVNPVTVGAGAGIGATVGAIAGLPFGLSPITGAAGAAAGTVGGVMASYLADKTLNSPMTQARLRHLDSMVKLGKEMFDDLVDGYWGKYSGKSARAVAAPTGARIPAGHPSQRMVYKGIEYKKGMVGKFPRFLALKSIARGMADPNATDREMDLSEASDDTLADEEIANVGRLMKRLSQDEELTRKIYEDAMPGLANAAPHVDKEMFTLFENYTNGLGSSFPDDIDMGPLEDDIPPTKQQLHDWLNDVAIVRENGTPEIMDRIEKKTLTRKAWDEYEDQYPGKARKFQMSALAYMSDPDVRDSLDYTSKMQWEIVLNGLMDVRAMEIGVFQNAYAQKEKPNKPSSGLSYSQTEGMASAGTTGGILGRAKV